MLKRRDLTLFRRSMRRSNAGPYYAAIELLVLLPSCSFGEFPSITGHFSRLNLGKSAMGDKGFEWFLPFYMCRRRGGVYSACNSVQTWWLDSNVDMKLSRTFNYTRLATRSSYSRWELLSRLTKIQLKGPDHE